VPPDNPTQPPPTIVYPHNCRGKISLVPSTPSTSAHLSYNRVSDSLVTTNTPTLCSPSATLPHYQTPPPIISPLEVPQTNSHSSCSTQPVVDPNLTTTMTTTSSL
jgi:hypothetical protein